MHMSLAGSACCTGLACITIDSGGGISQSSTEVPPQVWRHTLGSDPKDDALVYHETDDAFYIGVGRTRSNRFLYISAGAPAAALRKLFPLPSSSHWAQ